MLDKVLRSTMLLTVAEVKPFSGELDNDLKAHQLLAEGVRTRQIANPDLAFYMVKAHPDGSNFDTTILNRKAAARLSRDKGVISLFGRHSIQVPADYQGWVDLFDKAAAAGWDSKPRRTVGGDARGGSRSRATRGSPSWSSTATATTSSPRTG
ncbi:MAG: hypothetical protein HY748_05440 [Elusimicrobia bacterium]|nr:hypothetical protein [Elusimicrobiota bacterium]